MWNRALARRIDGYWGAHSPSDDAARSARWISYSPDLRHFGCLYRFGLALFDLESPEKCLLRGNSWIFGPEADYERSGDVNDVVFPRAYTMDPDGDTVNIYSRAADCPIALARARVRALLEWWGANGNLERPASAGRMTPVLWAFEFVFRCRHRQLSRTISLRPSDEWPTQAWFWRVGQFYRWTKSSRRASAFSCRPFCFDLDPSLTAGCIVAKTAPLPVLRTLAQAPVDR
jgi:hypothetical protein